MQNPPTNAGLVDILGLADKAAQALQSQQRQTQTHFHSGQPQQSQQQQQQTFQPQQPNTVGQYGSYSPVPPPSSVPGMMPGLPQMQQAYGQQQQSYPPIQQYQPQQQQHASQSSAAGQQRRRTTANLTDLPVGVQNQIYQIQATRQVDQPLDDGLLGMIKDLPENLAVQALQKFQTLDKSTMRNKTAYLAGVLRRELEKIHRR
jgi:hypothetical protein